MPPFCTGTITVPLVSEGTGARCSAGSAAQYWYSGFAPTLRALGGSSEEQLAPTPIFGLGENLRLVQGFPGGLDITRPGAAAQGRNARPAGPDEDEEPLSRLVLPLRQFKRSQHLQGIDVVGWISGSFRLVHQPAAPCSISGLCWSAHHCWASGWVKSTRAAGPAQKGNTYVVPSGRRPNSPRRSPSANRRLSVVIYGSSVQHRGERRSGNKVEGKLPGLGGVTEGSAMGLSTKRP